MHSCLDEATGPLLSWGLPTFVLSLVLQSLSPGGHHLEESKKAAGNPLVGMPMT